MICRSNVKARDKLDRLRVQWEGGKYLYPESKRTEVNYNEDAVSFDLGDPHAISGGGLWRFRTRTTRGIIAPHFELIGIASKILSRGDHWIEEIYEPVELWRTWLEGVETEIDGLQ
jgi:hypothetical protein